MHMEGQALKSNKTLKRLNEGKTTEPESQALAKARQVSKK